MGVDITHYVIVGIKTKFNELEEIFKLKEFDDLEDMFKDIIIKEGDANIGDFTYVSDGMNGEYAILGIIVDKGVEEDGERLGMIDCIKAYNKYRTDVCEKLRKMNISIGEISVYAFTHYS